jgi:DNA invertase Pin-like site-specific DNA recombinase
MDVLSALSIEPPVEAVKDAIAPYTSNNITTEHLIREAVVYLRVSTEKQVEKNQESLRYQMNMTRRAAQLGWSRERTRVITEDLAVSAVYGVRKGFWNLLNDVAEGKVGIVFVFDSSRATRKAGDMYALVDAAIISGTLIAEKDRIYDPRDFNDRMLLYLSGLFNEAEWHRFRMRGIEGRMEQVLRGEYRQRLPTGLIRLPDREVVKDPEVGVQETIDLVFQKFRELGSCRKVLRELNRADVKLPRFRHNGPNKMRLVWSPPSKDNILNIIGNPAYAGAFVYGRRHWQREYSQREGKAGRCVRTPMEEWVIVEGVYPAYITWEEYMANRRRLSALSDDFKQLVKRSPGEAREGAALLSKLARCGTCGSKMKVSYNPRGRYFCDAQVSNYGGSYCPSLHAGSVDAAVVEAFFDALDPSQIDALEDVLTKQSEEAEQTRIHLQRRVERARYKVERSETQYDSVDPRNRLVADELERRWEESLLDYKRLEVEYEQLLSRQQLGSGLTSEMRQQLQDMSETLRTLWEGGELPNSQKKELLGSLISGVVLKRVAADKTEARIAWVSGSCQVIDVSTSAERTSDLPSYEAMVVRVKTLWEMKGDDKAIAAKLTEEGHHSARSRTVLPSAVQKIRSQHGWVSPFQKRRKDLTVEGYLTATGLAGRLGVGAAWVFYRLKRGRIAEKYLAPHANQHVWLIKDDPELILQLQQEMLLRRSQGWKKKEH